MIDRDSTICAISTAAGVGGIAVIRVSGPDAISIVDGIFSSYRKDVACHVSTDILKSSPTHVLKYGVIVDGDETIDDVVCAIFKDGKSYTGEDTIEISCHGSIYIQKRIIELLLRKGCKMAGHGEFTQRAYLNGRMDLSQAEAVADLIASTSAKAHHIAVKQMKGGFSNELMQLRMSLLEFVSLIELELDFSEEDVEFADRAKLRELIDAIEQRVSKLANSFKAGNAIKNGIPVAIVGETNVGKSTLLNLLLGEERAIVSDIHGTTRDTIEDTLQVDGYTLRLIDTAGIRNTDDAIENLGIQRSYKMMEQADIVIFIVDAKKIDIRRDGARPVFACRIVEDGACPVSTEKPTLLLFNKCDICDQSKIDELMKMELPNNIVKIPVSAKNGVGKEAIESALAKFAESIAGEDNDVIVTSARHYAALCDALAGIDRVKNGLNTNLSGDLISRDIHDILDALASITGGEITTDEVLGNIFAHFCIGK
ncbi:MAG: tRNA uridine-5-carboxymethylaminomethyl(34) synthesis GTPase MnmE [Paludibacteraceae bacterium]|nr:tRNA uridine-5-carboxymethylaminomethyl(34) synthesis GTPase MnmE [Paludibacteraceae bacterium]